MKPPLISIIIPVYNTAPYLERCINSLLAQTYGNIEIILVNDGSMDDSGIICDRYASKYENILAIHQKNSGPMSACRNGISLSIGGYLCFMDSDDWVDEEMISKMAGQLNYDGDEIICCNMITERAYNAVKDQHGLAPGEYVAERHQEIFRNILGNEKRQIILSRCMKLFSRNLIVDNLIYCDDKLKMGEDSVMSLLALFDSKRIVIMEDAFFYHYFYNKDSLVHGYSTDMYQQIIRLRECFKRIMTDKVKLHGFKISETEIEAQYGREFLIMLTVALKNEARGNRKYSDYREKVKKICQKEKTFKWTRRYPLKLSGKANRILFMVLKYPCRMTFWLLRIVTKIFYSGRNVKSSSKT